MYLPVLRRATAPRRLAGRVAAGCRQTGVAASQTYGRCSALRGEVGRSKAARRRANSGGDYRPGESINRQGCLGAREKRFCRFAGPILEAALLRIQFESTGVPKRESSGPVLSAPRRAAQLGQPAWPVRKRADPAH